MRVNESLHIFIHAVHSSEAESFLDVEVQDERRDAFEQAVGDRARRGGRG